MVSSPTQTKFRRWWSRARTSFFWMVLFALILRVGIITIGHTYKFRTNDNNFSFGWEMGRIGRAIAAGEGFSSPFNERTGPTAWEPPLYPYLIAGEFKVFGIYSHGSALVLLTLNSIFSALTCIPIFLIARRCFGQTVAVWSGWLWALLPNVTFWCTRWVWETSLATFLLALLFWLTLVMDERDGWRPWIEYGLLWGVAGLTNTTVLAFLPASGLWIWYRRWKAGKSSIGGVILASALFLACIFPWTFRNHQVLGQWILVRSNLGAELRLGNGPGADGTWMFYLHPTQNVYEMRRYRNMGEIPYVAARKQEAVDWIRQDPARFAVVSMKRFIYYWGGVPRLEKIEWLAPTKNSLFLASSVLGFFGLLLALGKRRPGAWLFFWLLLLYPAVYYVVFPHPRYRHPIEPELGMLIVYVISEAEPRKRRSQSASNPT